MSDFVHFAVEGHVALLTLNAPARRNAISSFADCDAVEAACHRIARDHAIRCVILTGADPAFCAGGDVKGMRDRTGIMAASGPGEMRENYRRGIQRIPLALWELDVPTIAAVNGPAIGAGLDLACMCDMRIASEKAILPKASCASASSPATAAPGCCPAPWASPWPPRCPSPAIRSMPGRRWRRGW
jgi:enoyl-CoA hydratase/carnithine racemase